MSEANAPNDPPTPQEPPTVQPQVTVTTLPFALTPEVCFRVMIRDVCWNNWWMIVFSAVGFLLFLSLNYNFHLAIQARSVCFVACLLFCFFFMLLTLRPLIVGLSFAYHPSNKVLMQNAVLILTKDQIIFNESESECVSTHTRKSIFAIEKCKGYYLIWITHFFMIYLPKNAFASREDLKIFESEILPAYPEKKRSLRNDIVILVICCLVLGLFAAFLYCCPWP